MAFSRGTAQQTLRGRVTLSGIGVHSGKPVVMSVCPAGPNNGITFVRTDLSEANAVEIPAVAGSLRATELCTVLGDLQGASVATVEHLLAALFALRVDNAVVEIDGAEAPIMDGSAEAFVEAIVAVGLIRQAALRRFIRILRPVRIDAGQAFAEFLPYKGCRFEVEIDFDCAVIGRQSFAIELTPKSFRKEIARARTFGHLRDVKTLWASGFALGSSLDNSVVVGDGEVVNPEGLRYRDEFVRHKVLDAIGDLALAGAPIQGLYRSFRGGHKLNAAAVKALLSQRDAWCFVSAPAERERRGEARAEIMAGLLAPAFAPEVA